MPPTVSDPKTRKHGTVELFEGNTGLYRWQWPGPGGRTVLQSGKFGP